ncbi:response regulator transcription factor [Pseudoxanthomonas composti]|uniref:Response regulator transcription factor n=1 Tax=Pseudoxanthomonas composti TaxID=2137479 RepID=A0A4Q1JT41_9GAMM|nr:response regulator [Pseudoxanthomonas composti]RXQ99895.1 response regulator transcription factor [Pseudoxanthomonas composti]
MHTVPRVLVVEDHALVAETIRMTLEQNGFEVAVEGDGLNGLARAVQSPFDLLIVDVDLPLLDGVQLCNRIRDARDHTLPVIMLTGRAHPADRAAGLEAGADIYMTKPFEGGDLIGNVRRLLAMDATTAP